MKLADLKNLDIEATARVIEADLEAEDGESVPADFSASLRESLAQAKRGEYGRVTTPEQIMARQRGRPAGSVAVSRKEQATLRFDPDVLARWRASGKGWQTRAAAVLAQHAP